MISRQAFDKLTAMGIPLYHLRGEDCGATSVGANTAEAKQTSFIHIDKAQIVDETFFSDLLLSLNLVKSDISFSKTSIDLGTFTWRFIAPTTSASEEQNTKEKHLEDNALEDSALEKNAAVSNAGISFSNNTLITLPIETLKQSPVLKKQLWQMLPQLQ